MKIASTFQFENIQGFKFGSNPFGQPKMFAHVYFIDGLLIDTGHRNMRKEIMKLLHSLPVHQIYITHHHEDHTGNLKQLQDHFKCPTYASSMCVELMKKPPKISPAQWMTWGNRPANFNIQIQENHLKTPNYCFEIIPIPGHAVDMVCLFEREKGWLFSADLWVHDYIRYFMRAESMRQQIESMKKVLTLDFEVMLCSHNPQFKNGKNRLEKKLQFFEDFYGEVAKLNHQGYSISSIIREMNLKRSWQIRILSLGELSTINMVRSVIRDEESRLGNLFYK